MKQIKLFDPVVEKRDFDNVLKTISSGFWTSGSGSGQVLEFENSFKN